MITANKQPWEESVINRDDPLPLYFQLKQVLLKHIQDGDINPGELLPSEKVLEELYGVSQITVRRALRELALEGHIVRQAGRGSFVRQVKLQDRSAMLGGFVADLVAQGYQVESQILEYRECPATARLAEQLNIEIGKKLLYFKRLVFADSESIAVTQAYFNVGSHVVFTREELRRDSIFPLLERTYGIVLRRAEKSVEVTVALEDEADVLGVAPNSPLMLTELVVYNEKDTAVGFVKTLYRGDRYKYYITLTR